MSNQDLYFQPIQHTSTIELSRSAFSSNVAFVRQLLGSDTQLSAVLKGNAYGHGLEQMTELCLSEGIYHISVFSAQEAYRILQHAKQPVSIMIMGMIDALDIPWAIANQISFFVFEPLRLAAAIKAAKSLQRKAKIHLEVETGMNRTGLDEDEIKEIIGVLKGHRLEIDLLSLCTHFAGAEDMANEARIRTQLKRFNTICELFNSEGIPPKMRQTACSAACLNYPETRMGLARIGIMLYGFWPNQETRLLYMRQMPGLTDPLRRLIRWKSKVMSIKLVKKGEYVGYGSSFLASKNMKIAIVPVGYAYGFSRSLSNAGRVLVGGRKAAVVGVVNMNLLMIDITDVEYVQPNDEVVLIGQQGEEVISVSSFSEMNQQLNYEMLSRLPSEIPRLIVE